jgi:hypothetical protein
MSSTEAAPEALPPLCKRFPGSGICKIKRHHREEKGDQNQQQKKERLQDISFREIKYGAGSQGERPEQKHQAYQYLCNDPQHGLNVEQAGKLNQMVFESCRAQFFVIYV